MKDYGKIVKLFAIFGQLGFSIVTPPIVLALGAYMLQRRFFLGNWVMILAIILGMLAAASSVYQFYRRVLSSDKKKKAEADAVVFYHHE